MSIGNTSGDGSGTARHLLTDSTGRIIIAPESDVRRDISLAANTTLAGANGNDKDMTLSAGKNSRLRSLFLTYTSDATVGNRQIVLEFEDDSDNVLFQVTVGLVQAASLVYKYSFAPGLPDLTSVRNTTHVMTPIPSDLWLGAEYVIRIYDATNVSTSDSMTVRAIVEEQDE